MKQAHDWAVEKYESWGISAENQEWGQWKGWERGVTHIDMIHPRIQTLKGTQLAWNPGTPAEGITAETIVLPEFEDAQDFQNWLPSVKGKFVMIAMKQPTGRPDYDWEEWATPESFEKMKKEREEQTRQWRQNLSRTGYNARTIIPALEEAGAAGIIDSYWSQGFGVSKIFGARTKNIPTVNIELEDYTMLYRMVEHGDEPQVRIVAEAKDLGVVPTFNTIAQIKGSEKPDEYVVLSAHFDSWDGATGATDNGTGTVTMMEAMRILKKVLPNPKRTILVGHWSGEEQGLNGSRAFAQDHPEIVEGLQALFNQDNGTGRIVNISMQGFTEAGAHFGRWLSQIPTEITQHIELSLPGVPSSGGTDHASFVCYGAPAFNLSALHWEYRIYTWHTNRDTFDKIVFDDLKNNATLTAMLAYLASEDPERVSTVQRDMPINPRTGTKASWPNCPEPVRSSADSPRM